MMEEHPFAQYVRILGKGKKGTRSLTRDEARSAMGMILDGQAEDLQLGAFLMLLRVKEETPEELCGFVEAARARFNAPSELRADLDWSSYAGKRRHPPWFLLSLRALAQTGKRILIHGTEGHTAGRIYTRTTADALGLPICDNWDEVAAAFLRGLPAYLPLASFSPVLERIIQMRNILGLRSPVHSFTRLLNPLGAPAVMQGIFHPPYAPLHQHAALLLGYQKAGVIKGEGGEIERNPGARCRLHLVESGACTEEEWPAIMDGRQPGAEDLSVSAMQAVWMGDRQDAYAEEAIVGTIALALRVMEGLPREGAMRQAERVWSQRKRDVR